MDIILNELPDTELNDNEWKYEENPEIFSKYNQFQQVKIEKIPEIEVVKDIKKSKIVEKKPIELIMVYTSTTEIMRTVIKDRLIEFITAPEFSKAFGVKKSSEIISAITRNAWNQSMALFISFLLDATVIYKEKQYIYNKDKVTKNEICVN